MDDESDYYDEYPSVDVYNDTDTPSEFTFSDYSQRVVVAVLYLIASVLGVCGNSLVILAVVLSRKLRTTTNAFLVNLSVADLLTSLVIPWDAVELLGKDDRSISSGICSVVAVLQYTTVGCSMYTLASVGLNRLLLITRPTTIYRIIDTPRKITVWLVITWLVPLLIVLVPPLNGVGGVGYNRKYHNCGSQSYHPRSDIYDVIIAGVLYPIPLITIIVCYALIWRHLNRHAKKLLSYREEPGKTLNNCSPSASSTLPVISPTSPGHQTLASTRQGIGINRFRMNRFQYEVTRNMLYVVCAFLICLTPFAICLFYDASDPFLPYASAILVFNICINPLIYATKHRDFKAVFRCILRRKWEDIPEPSDVLKTLRQIKRRSCLTQKDDFTP